GTYYTTIFGVHRTGSPAPSNVRSINGSDGLRSHSPITQSPTTRQHHALSFYERDRADLYTFDRAFTLFRSAGDGADVVHTFDDLAEYCIAFVKIGDAVQRDEKLRIRRINVLAPSGPENARVERNVRKFRGNVRFARTANAVVVRVVVLGMRVASLAAGLIDAVKGRAVVKSFVRKFLGTRGRFGRDVRIRFELDLSKSRRIFHLDHGDLVVRDRLYAGCYCCIRVRSRAGTAARECKTERGDDADK